eukprot:TRINITY_DN3431_c0_g1_i2.p1 TRINITY_DN3431_c0_g1~~TRINITY_DN3431_c0_g1_i2.p1  ORF type:complete len:297 (-),score=58.29 TRINITY_DN3431_c0_g1_i2:188-1078(-)
MELEELKLADLPEEILLLVFGNLKPVDLGRVSSSCKLFHTLLDDQQFWQRMCVIHGFGDIDGDGDWKRLFAELYYLWFRLDTVKCHRDVVISHNGKIASYNSERVATFGNNFHGVQGTRAIPKDGIFFFECIFNNTATSSGNAFAIGVSGDGYEVRSESGSPGWWSNNAGTGWYNNGDIFTYSNRVGSAPAFQSGDRVGVEVNRERGTIAFYHNGVRHDSSVITNPLISTDVLYGTCILIAPVVGEVRLLRAHRVGNSRTNYKSLDADFGFAASDPRTVTTGASGRKTKKKKCVLM